MTHKVGPKGQVVIPKAMRGELGLEPGDEVDFELTDGAVLVKPLRHFASLRGTFAGEPLLEVLEAEHRAEVDKDERRRR